MSQQEEAPKKKEPVIVYNLQDAKEALGRESVDTEIIAVKKTQAVIRNEYDASVFYGPEDEIKS